MGDDMTTALNDSRSFRNMSVRVYEPFLSRLEELAGKAEVTPNNYIMEIVECWMNEHRPCK